MSNLSHKTTENTEHLNENSKSQRQRLFEQFLHSIPHRGATRRCRAKFELEQIRLHIRIGCVKDHVQLCFAGHFRHIIMAIHHLGNIQYFVGQTFAHLLTMRLSLILIVEVDELQSHRPHLPRNTLRLEGPSIAFLLEKLQTNLAGASTVGAAQLLAKAADLTFNIALKGWRGTTDVREINEITIDVHVADSAHRIGGVAGVHEFADAAMKEDRVKDAGHRLIHLPALHRQLEDLRTGVHDCWF